MALNDHWGDEALADAVLQKMPPERTEELHAHLETCQQCLRRYKKWQTLLTEAPGQAYDASILKKRLQRDIARVNRKTSALRGRLKVFAAMGTAASLLFALLFFQSEPAPPRERYTAIQDGAPAKAAFINDPHTSQYNVTPVIAADIQGVVWVNDTSKEMFIHVEGLAPRAHKDYQIWFVDTNGRIQNKVLNLQNGKAALYLRGDGIKHIKHVRMSLEPKGGSPAPTGEDALIIDLNR